MRDKSRTEQALSPEALAALAEELEQLREELIAREGELASLLEIVRADNLPSARNLVHYLALRRRDMRRLQLRLARAGLSSLGRSESHVLVTINRILAMLALARSMPLPRRAPPPVGFRQGEKLLAANTNRLLGAPPAHRAVRIIVTLPTEAATDPKLAQELLEAGMDCARINCAHDDPATWSGMAENVRAAEQALGRACRILVDLTGPRLRTGLVAGGAEYLLLYVGDRFDLVTESAISAEATGGPRRIACAAPEIFEHVRPGQPIWFNEGKIGGIIEERTSAGLRIRVTQTRPQGRKLRPERGINLPATDLVLPAMGEKDRADLTQVAAWADLIGLSFAQSEEDVLALQLALQEYDERDIAIILKIETRRAFANLPQLLLTAMRARRCGVMIARGDLAVESGFARMAEVQEEILWIAEAAHVPTIWATQVLENLAKTGMLSRAEVTDAAMSGRAEAVMLNKGPFIVDAIRTLDDILRRMRSHQSKKRPLFRALRVSEQLWD